MSDLRVLVLNHADGSGGAAIAGRRLHVALRRAGADSSMLVGAKGSHDANVAELRPLRTVRRPLRKLTEGLGFNELDGVSAYGIGRRNDFRRADIVHYHAIHGSWFSYPAMPGLTRAKPSVLTLHDMWPLTGHCSFDFGCGRWSNGCGSCPHPEAFPAIQRDSTAAEWRLKHWLWERSDLVVVSPSVWLADVARRSMLGRFDVKVIPHGLDTDVFRPRERGAARTALGLPADDPVVLFAASSLADRRKGADLVLSVMERLAPRLRAGTTVALMGDRGPQMGARLAAEGFRVADFGFVPGDDLKALLYSTADVFVFPTRADNSPLVVLESLACGTPVASFNVGGVAEMVRPDRTGVLAPPEDVDGLAHELSELLGDPDRAHKLGREARDMVVNEFGEALSAERHLALYRRLLDRPTG